MDKQKNHKHKKLNSYIYVGCIIIVMLWFMGHQKEMSFLTSIFGILLILGISYIITYFLKKNGYLSEKMYDPIGNYIAKSQMTPQEREVERLKDRVYDHKAGSALMDGIFTRAGKDSDHVCWKIFWSRMPQEWKEAYDIGYHHKKNRIRFNKFIIACVVAALPLYYILFDRTPSAARSSSELDIGTILGYIFLFIILFILYKFIAIPYKTLEEQRWFRKRFVTNKYEKFTDQVNAMFKEFYFKYGRELAGENLMGNLLGYVAGAAVGIGLAAGHLGAVVAAGKMMAGKPLSATNVVSTVSGVGAAVDAVDGVDAVTSVADAADAADGASSAMDAADAADAAGSMADMADMSEGMANVVNAAGDVSDMIADNDLLTAMDINDAADAVSSVADAGSICDTDTFSDVAATMSGSFPYASSLGINCDILPYASAAMDGGINVCAPDGSLSLSMDDGKIFNAEHQQIGSYGYDIHDGSFRVLDQNGNLAYAVDRNGAYFDKDDYYLGHIDDEGAMTTFTDAEGNISYRLNLNGANVVDANTGTPQGSISKA